MERDTTNLSADAGNIGPSGQRQRRLFGVITMLAGFTLILWLDRAPETRLWRIAGFPLFWLGALGLLQAQAKTCVAHAARGSCDRDAPGVTEGRLSPEAAARLARRGRQILTRATIVAVVLTLLGLAVP